MHSIQTLPLSASALFLAAALLPVTVRANGPAGASISTFRFAGGFDVGVPPGGLVSSSGWDMGSLEFVHDTATDTIPKVVPA